MGLYKPPRLQLSNHRLSFLFSSRGAPPDPKMPSVKCLVVLLVVLEAAGCTTDTQERIKMCGRDLIRLAVSSCGNSRLRRSVPDVKEGRRKSTYQFTRCIYGFFCSFFNNCTWFKLKKSLILNPKCLSASSVDQETSREALWTTRPTPVPADDGEGISLVPRWHPVSPRLRRTAGKISDICCEKGCSMKELIQFC